VHIFKVNSGQAALDLLAQESVDIVLMDMVMPDMDGLVTTRHLREIAGLRALPVVGLTATSQSQDIAQCLAAGMDEVLMKPIDAKLLCSCIERLLQKARHA
jgi:CheY-like chemotaxis protein